jgi:hypothetical protein
MIIITTSTDRSFRTSLTFQAAAGRQSFPIDGQAAEFLELERPACFEIDPMAPAVRQAPA